MKRYFSLISLLLFGLSASTEEFFIKSGNGFLYTDNLPPNVTGNIFIFSRSDINNAAITFSVEESTSFECYAYEHDPANAVRLESTDYDVAEDGKSTTLNRVTGNHGYYVEYENIRKYLWIAIYAPIDDVTWDTDFMICNHLQLYIQPIMRYILADNSGYRREGPIQRDLKIEYFTFKEENRETGIYEISDEHSSVTDVLVLDLMPYVDTEFTITDDFGVKLRSDSAVFVTDTFYTSAVTAFPFMRVTNKQPNELDPSESWETDEFNNVVMYFSETLSENMTEFRTSAPLSIDLVSEASPKVNRFEWYFSRDANFAVVDFVFFDRELNRFIFKEPGKHYVKLIVLNNVNSPDEVCEYTVYASFNIAESELLVPNAFTPNGDGHNDVFKVAYRSIASYHCRIYAPWGVKVYDSTDITQGWDGTIGGRLASIGVYFYVIDAKGTDGRVFKKRGDINLLRSK